MRKFILLLGLALLCQVCGAQSPLAFPYQAVARDSFGTPIPNQAMRIRLTLHDSTATGPLKYRETDTILTDNLGMFTINIGEGIPDSGTFTNINWASAKKYLQVELDPAGGTSYLNLGTSQLLSVPFALHSLSSSNLSAIPSKSIPFGGSNGLSYDTLMVRGSKGFTKILTKDTTRYTAGLLVGTNNNHTTAGHEVDILSIDSLNNYGAVTVSPYTASLNSFYNNFSGMRVVYVDSNGLHYVYGNGGNSYLFPNSKGNSGEVLTSDGSGSLTWQRKKNRFGITIDGLGDVITNGSKGVTQIAYNGTITGWTVIADQSGSCVIDLKKSTYSSYPTTTSVAGTALPTLSSAIKNQNTTLTGWGSTTITSGDMFEFYVTSASQVKRVTLIIETTMD